MKTKKNILLNVYQVALLLIGAAMLAVGLTRGEATQVLQKAIVVCMECIGIG